MAVCCRRGFAWIVGALPQFVQQSRILDGDDGLRCKVLNEFDLPVVKRTHPGGRSRWPRPTCPPSASAPEPVTRAPASLAELVGTGSAASPLLGQCENLCRKVAHHVAVERDQARDPEAVEDREQQQWIFGRFSERFGLFDQQTSPFRSRLGFRSGKSFEMNEWGYERDLELDLLATKRGSGGQLAIWPSARLSCSAASSSAERSSDRCPALAHHSMATSVRPAWVK